MSLSTARFLSLFFTALAMAAGFAHLLELPNKINLPRDEYRVVQKLYRGWALLGIAVVGALLSTLVVTMLVHTQPRAFLLTLIALFCIVGTQVAFWAVTFPVNRDTRNWTVLPDTWQALRVRWEYSHAAAAVLNLIALIALIASVLS
jgi:hypothetical protein